MARKPGCGCGPGLLGLALLLGVVVGGHYLAVAIDKWRFPWGYAAPPDQSEPAYLGQVVDFNYRNGDALAFANGSFTVIPESQLGMEDLL